MNMMVDGYCTIFVDAPATADEMAEALGARFGTLEPWNTVKSAHFELDVINNDDYLEPSLRTFRNDFLAYRVRLEIEPSPQTPRKAYFDAISDLLTWLWAHHYPAVAACDFENKLPTHELGRSY